MREVFDNLDEYEERMIEVLIDSATDESEVSNPIKARQQEDSADFVYLSRT